MACFFLAMTVFPEVQRKAQQEIDRKVGADRLPGFQDRQNLPYIDAIVKEVLRWHPVAPMGLPHMTTEDDICEGYLIPKGSLLLPNIWYVDFAPQSMMHADPLCSIGSLLITQKYTMIQWHSSPTASFLMMGTYQSPIQISWRLDLGDAFALAAILQIRLSTLLSRKP
jgi:hypothetical protein